MNDGAGVARTHARCRFRQTLSDQEALDVAEYFTHLPCPVYKFKARDWPSGDKPKDARS